MTATHHVLRHAGAAAPRRPAWLLASSLLHAGGLGLAVALGPGGAPATPPAHVTILQHAAEPAPTEPPPARLLAAREEVAELALREPEVLVPIEPHAPPAAEPHAPTTATPAPRLFAERVVRGRPTAPPSPPAPVTTTPRRVAPEVFRPSTPPPPPVATVDAAPSADNEPPPYPLAARQKGLEGEVVLRVEVAATGAVRTVTVTSSSGHAELDRAALRAARTWRYAPARRGAEPIDGACVITIEFSLRSRRGR